MKKCGRFIICYLVLVCTCMYVYCCEVVEYLIADNILN